jgi:hypothetical protein
MMKGVIESVFTFCELILVLEHVNMINKGFNKDVFFYGINMFCLLCLCFTNY